MEAAKLTKRKTPSPRHSEKTKTIPPDEKQNKGGFELQNFFQSVDFYPPEKVSTSLHNQQKIICSGIRENFLSTVVVT